MPPLAAAGGGGRAALLSVPRARGWVSVSVCCGSLFSAAGPGGRSPSPETNSSDHLPKASPWEQQRNGRGALRDLGSCSRRGSLPEKGSGHGSVFGRERSGAQEGRGQAAVTGQERTLRTCAGSPLAEFAHPFKRQDALVPAILADRTSCGF
ncbi:Hypothetical predicted protein [Marmota monax]|uniref:Uncharacterized protein n=1 Tax=Marmota monax TaxID=9995 RepID=A0A5E4C861_MARMO|nr:Hypothetical predicted protein [Marmota monax]